MMKTTKPLSGIAAILLCTALTVCICACGDGKKDNRNVSPSDTVSASAVLTDEEWVEKLLREEFETIYEKPYDEVVFTHIKIYTREEIKEIEEVAERTFDEKEIVFDVTFDIKPTDPKDVELFMIPNGTPDGEWSRENYLCGYLVPDGDNGYKLASYGTAF